MWSGWGGRAARAFSLSGLFVATAKDDKVVVPASAPIQVFLPEQKTGDVLLSRKIVNSLDKTGLNLRLYQYETCPFCCKVRAFLDYYGFSYEVVEVNAVTRSQIKFSTDYKKVPILRSNDKNTLLDSTLIISQLATYLTLPTRTMDQVEEMYPVVETVGANGKPAKSFPNKYFVMAERQLGAAEMAAAKEEREWREWVDDHFIHLISPNVYRTWEESLETFRWFEKVGEWNRLFPDWERVLAVYVGAAAMFALSKRLKKKHNIADEREAMVTACDAWVEALGGRKFMGGDRPNLADLALYGSMNAFYGCRAFKECVTGGKITEWFSRMKVEVEGRKGRDMLAKRAIVAPAA